MAATRGSARAAARGMSLPDPLDGVRTPADWPARREELLELLRTEQHGRRRPEPDVRCSASEPVARPGLDSATERRCRIAFEDREVEVLVVAPAGAAAAPCFVALNFGGNDAAVGTWPLATIVDRGFALATARYTDVAPDEPDADDRRGPHDAGRIDRWAWGLSRMIDLLGTVPGIDAERLIALGHSRLGKTALWAAATDERFAMCVAAGSGCGGAALLRARRKELLGELVTKFPHWYAPAFTAWSDREDELPFDAHTLLALIAPRPLHLADATEDEFVDAETELQSLVAASPVYRLLTGEGLDAASVPPAGTAIGTGAQRFSLRAGAHALTPEDWGHALDSAEALLP